MRQSNLTLGFQKEKGDRRPGGIVEGESNVITNAARLTNVTLGNCRNQQQLQQGYSHHQFHPQQSPPKYDNVSTARMLKVREANFILGN